MTGDIVLPIMENLEVGNWYSVHLFHYSLDSYISVFSSQNIIIEAVAYRRSFAEQKMASIELEAKVVN